MNSHNRQFTLAWLVVLFAAIYFVARGPYRAAQLTVDLPTFYGSTSAWLVGEDPYDHATIKRHYDDSGGDGQNVALCVNPPSFFPVMAPLGVPGYQTAKIGMIVANLAALGLALWAIAGAAGLSDRRAHALLLIAAAAALAPVQTTISQGQHGLLVLAALGLALRAELSRRDVLVGVCLAVAAALKPQMVALFGFYYLAQRRWAVVAAGALGTALLLGIGIARMELAGVGWLSGLRANMAAFTSAARDPVDMSGAANYAAMGDGRYIMIDIAALLHSFTDHAWAIRAARVFLGAAVVAAGCLLVPRRNATRSEALLGFALIGLGSIATMYNRYYAATVVVIAVAAAMRLILYDRQRLGWFVLAAGSPFVLPGVAILLKARSGPLDGHWLTESFVWRYLLLPHQVYTLLFTVAMVALALAKMRRRDIAPLTCDESGKSKRDAIATAVPPPTPTGR